jgi:hypothetical protein
MSQDSSVEKLMDSSNQGEGNASSKAPAPAWSRVRALKERLRNLYGGGPARALARELVTWIVAGVLPLVGWIVLLIIVIDAISTDRQMNNKENAKFIGNLKIYNKGRTAYREWESKEVIAFAMNQTSSTISYMLVAASALLGFIGKVLIDPIIKPKENASPSLAARLLLYNAMFGCLCSMLCGIMGNGLFPRLLVRPEFSIYDSLGVMALMQQVSLLLAGITFLVAIVVHQVSTRPSTA